MFQELVDYHYLQLQPLSFDNIAYPLPPPFSKKLNYKIKFINSNLYPKGQLNKLNSIYK